MNDRATKRRRKEERKKERKRIQRERRSLYVRDNETVREDAYLFCFKPCQVGRNANDVYLH